MTKDSLRELYIDELKDLFSAENQLVKALPKMAIMCNRKPASLIKGSPM